MFGGATGRAKGRGGNGLHVSEEALGWGVERRWAEVSQQEPVPEGQ